MVVLRKISILALLLSVFGVCQAFAAGSGAYRVEVPDAGAFGKGSAFVGQADTPAAVYYNPAGMTQIVGQAVSVGVNLIEPHVTYKGPSSPDANQMKRGDYAIPDFYYVTRLGTEKIALGIGALSSWGLTTEWMSDSFTRFVATKTSMTNKDYLIALAYKVNEQWSLSAGLDIDQSRLVQEKKVDQSPATANLANARLVADDVAVGYRLAVMFKLNDKNQFGLMYRSAIHHQYAGKLYLNDLDPNIQNAKHFPGASYSTDVLVKSVLPQSLVFGYSFKPDAKWTFNADVEWMDWSQVKETNIQYTSETDETRLSLLNSGNPVNKDWHSSWSMAMGAEYAMTDRLRLRSGYYIHQSPVNKATWDPSVPDSDSLGVTMGSGYDVTKNMTVDLAWSGIMYKVRKVNNDVGKPGPLMNGKYYQWTNIVAASATYKF